VGLHVCNPGTQRLRQEDLELEASLATQRDPVLRRKKERDPFKIKIVSHISGYGLRTSRHYHE
jgi:hypothetical protein